MIELLLYHKIAVGHIWRPWALSIGRKIPVLISGNGTALSGISSRGQPRARNTQMFVNFLLGISVPFNFIPGISGGERERCAPIRPKIPVSITVISSGIFGKKEDNFARFTQIVENLLREISVPSDIWKFSGKVTEKSTRKLMNFRNVNHSNENSEISGRKIKGNGNFR